MNRAHRIERRLDSGNLEFILPGNLFISLVSRTWTGHSMAILYLTFYNILFPCSVYIGLSMFEPISLVLCKAEQDFRL